MRKITRDTFIDIDKYCEHLTFMSKIYLDMGRLENRYADAYYLKHAYDDMVKRYVDAVSGGTIPVVSYKAIRNDYIYKFLLNFEHCPDYIFKTHKTKSGWSLNQDTVLIPLYDKGYATDFLNIYLKFKTYKSLVSTISAIKSKHTYPADVVGNNGEALNTCPYSIEPRQNYRYYYNNYNLISIPKICNTCVVAPKGKVLAWGDFAQADLRAAYNIYIRDEENIKTVSQYSDMYEAIARIIYGDEFNLEDFKQKRDIMKAVILSCVYGKRTDIDKEKADFLKEFGNYLDNQCPKYKEYIRRVKQHIEFRDDIVLDTYFGLPVVADRENMTVTQVMDKCLNYPIQSCTSLVMIITVNQILDQFYKLGYTEDQVGVYYTRHDEVIFIMDEEAMKDSWIFKDFNKIFIDDWYPMKLDFEFGYHYKESSPTLTHMYEDSIKRNNFRIKEMELGERVGEDFYPLKPVLILEVGTALAYNGETVIAIYNDNSSECLYLKCPEDEVIRLLESVLAQNEKEIKDRGYGGVIIENNLVVKQTTYHSLLLFNYKPAATSIAKTLATNMAYKFAKKYNAETEYDYINMGRAVKTIDKLLPD